jgi:hypothetical protein
MIDSEGFRPNVGIVICNRLGQLLWAKRIGQSAWQFPQGGINSDESLEQALYRELMKKSAWPPVMSKFCIKPTIGCGTSCRKTLFAVTRIRCV